MELNPYEVPEVRDPAEIPSGAGEARRDSRKDIEGAVAIAVTMLLAGVWSGARYLGASFYLFLTSGTVGIFVAAIGYAIAAKRLRVLLFLPLLLFAIIGQEIVSVLFLCGGFIGFPIATLAALVRSTRQKWMFSGKLALVGLAAFSSLFLHDRFRRMGTHRAADRGQVVIEAIDRFQAREGRLPSTLSDLVPRDLPSIPDTGMSAFPSFHYNGPTSDADIDEQRLFETYELRVNLYRLMNFDSLIYWPERNYPDSIYGSPVGRIGDWAYVYE